MLAIEDALDIANIGMAGLSGMLALADIGMSRLFGAPPSALTTCALVVCAVSSARLYARYLK